MFVLALSLYNTWNRGVFLLCKITNLLIYSYILTYGLGVALAGIAGSLLTQFYTIYPTAGASFGFRALIVVVVGGLGSIPGAFFAGIFLGLLEQMSALFISPSYSDMIVFVTFIIILVVRQVMILRRR